MIRLGLNKSQTISVFFVTVAIVEIERLWYRFKMLGCNDDGILTSDVLQRPPASEDIFVKNVSTGISSHWSIVTIVRVFCLISVEFWLSSGCELTFSSLIISIYSGTLVKPNTFKPNYCFNWINIEVFFSICSFTSLSKISDKHKIG